jgi:hypothetical protein
MQYNQIMDEKIYYLLEKNNRMRFNSLLEEIFPKYEDRESSRQHPSTKYYIRNNQEVLRQHLKKMLNQKIIETEYGDPNQSHYEFGKPKYYRLSEATKWQRHYGFFEGVKSKRIGKEETVKTQKKKPRFKDLSKIEQKKIAYQLILSHIGQGSHLTIRTDSPEAGNFALYNKPTKEFESFSSKSLDGFRISELFKDRKIRKISSIEDIKETTFSKISLDMNNYIFTQHYSQLSHPKNKFVYLELSQKEIEECIKLLKDEEYPIIRASGSYNGETLYSIEDGDKKMKNVNDDEIKNTTFILTCDYIFGRVFNRMRLIWMFRKKHPYPKEQINWFRYIYGKDITTEFFLGLKEQKQEYENRIKEHWKDYPNKTFVSPMEKQQFMENEIKKEVDNSIKKDDEAIKETLDNLEKKYSNKIKERNKIFYDLMLEIIYPSFLRKEYSTN